MLHVNSNILERVYIMFYGESLVAALFLSSLSVLLLCRTLE